jgi:hypothetical protein
MLALSPGVGRKPNSRRILASRSSRSCHSTVSNTTRLECGSRPPAHSRKNPVPTKRRKSDTCSSKFNHFSAQPPFPNVKHGLEFLLTEPHADDAPQKEEQMELLHRRCCGPDVHKETVVACRRRQHQGSGSREGVHRFPENARRRRCVQGEGGESGLKIVALFLLCGMAARGHFPPPSRVAADRQDADPSDRAIAYGGACGWAGQQRYARRHIHPGFLRRMDNGRLFDRTVGERPQSNQRFAAPRVRPIFKLLISP